MTHKYVTCRTAGCDNEGQTVHVGLPQPPTPAIICGVCGQPITDITGSKPIPDTEVPEWLT